LTIDIISGDGEITTRAVTTNDALSLFREAESGLIRAGIALHGRVDAKPGAKLIDLIKANKAAQEADGELAE
jgi:hypothetical protein